MLLTFGGNSADSVSRSPGASRRSRPPRTSRGKFLRRGYPAGVASPLPPSVRYVTRLMELAKDPFPVDRVCRWRRLTWFPPTRTKRELLVILALAISLREPSPPAVATFLQPLLPVPSTTVASLPRTLFVRSYS